MFLCRNNKKNISTFQKNALYGEICGQKKRKYGYFLVMKKSVFPIELYGTAQNKRTMEINICITSLHLNILWILTSTTSVSHYYNRSF